MTVIDRVRAEVAGRLKSRANSLLATATSAATSKALSFAGGVLAQVDEAQKALIDKALGAVNANAVLGDLVRAGFGNIGQQLGGSVGAAAGRATAQLQRQAGGRVATALQNPLAPGMLRAAPARPRAPPPAGWTAAPLWGGLTPAKYRELFVESAMTSHSWKNLFYVAITERKPSLESPFGLGKINLLALDLSFGPCTLAGEATALGAVNMDGLSATERTELRMTTLDDDAGTVKRWFAAKCDQAARTDGTFGLPADYLVTVDITHMAPTNAGSNDDRMRHRFLMRPVSMELELSRRSAELEELQLSFVQFDTFMVPK